MNILIPIIFGSEVRQFFHSGLVEELNRKGHKIITCIKDEKSPLINELPEYVKVVSYPTTVQLNYLFLLINEVLEDESKKTLSFKSKSTKHSIKGKLYLAVLYILKIIIRIGVLRNLLPKLELYFLLKSNPAPWNVLLKEEGIDKIIINVPNVEYPMLVAAKNNNIRLYLFYHTNKDLLTQRRFVLPYDVYGVWSKTMKNDLIQSTSLDADKVKVTGCLHFAQSKNTSVSQRGNQQPKFLYICGALNVVNETLLLEQSIALIEKVFDKNYQLTIRVNPMETRDIWRKYVNNQVSIHYPKWYYNPKKNFNYATKQDQEEFNALLKSATAVMGLPSTVFIESIIHGKAFVCLLFNRNVYITYTQKDATSLWNLEIYDQIKNNPYVIPVFDENKFIELLTDLKNNNIGLDSALRDKSIEEMICSENAEHLINLHVEALELEDTDK